MLEFPSTSSTLGSPATEVFAFYFPLPNPGWLAQPCLHFDENWRASFSFSMPPSCVLSQPQIPGPPVRFSILSPLLPPRPPHLPALPPCLPKAPCCDPFLNIPPSPVQAISPTNFTSPREFPLPQTCASFSRFLRSLQLRTPGGAPGLDRFQFLGLVSPLAAGWPERKTPLRLNFRLRRLGSPRLTDFKFSLILFDSIRSAPSLSVHPSPPGDPFSCAFFCSPIDRHWRFEALPTMWLPF